MSTKLQLAVNGKYFDQIKNGEKTEEYRLFNDYWKKRLINRTYDRLIITRGYPRKDDNERILNMHYRGYEIKTINHEFFGNNPVKVFAIKLEVQQS